MGDCIRIRLGLYRGYMGDSIGIRLGLYGVISGLYRRLARDYIATNLKLDHVARKSRDREKGRQATGPLWLHLSAQAIRV